MGLRAKTAKAFMWSSGFQIIREGIFMLVSIILARILFPEDFGMVGFVVFFVGLALLVNEFGLGSAIIQRKKLNDKHLSTAFWVNAIFGTLLFLIMFSSSGMIASFFKNPAVKPIARAFSIVFIFGSLMIVQRAILKRDLNFKKLAIVESVGVVVSAIISISMALSGFGVWSLVVGRISTDAVAAAGHWISSKWRPGFVFDKKALHDMLPFGLSVVGERVVNYASGNIDILLVGRFLGSYSLGIYTVVYKLVTVPVRKLSQSMMKVVFPAFSRIQDNNERMKRGYLKVIRYISFVTFPIFIGMFAVAPEFILAVYTAKWADAIIPLRILCVAGLLYSVGTSVGSIFLAKGRADLELKLNFFRAIMLSIAIFIGISYGVVGVAYAVSGYAIFHFFFMQSFANRLIDLKMHKFVKALFPALIPAIIMGAGVLVFKTFLLSYNLWIQLLMQVLFGIGLYVLVYFLINRTFFDEIKKLLIEVIKK